MMTEYQPSYGTPRSHEYDDNQEQQQQQQQHQQQQHLSPSDQLQLQQQQQPQRSSTLERGRSIRLMRNGDSFFPGRGFVVNQRKYPMLDVFLDDASLALRANFGAVRCIYTPKSGTRLNDISELEDHRTYVAGGGERFKKLHYLDIAEGKRVQNREKPPSRLPPVRRYDVEGRAMKLSRSENVIIYVYRNGDPLTLPAKILLVKSTLQNWESILDEVTRKVSLVHSAVLKLYAMNGELTTSSQQLEYNGMYVAAGKERYKRIDYPDPKSFSPNSSPKMSRKSSNHQFSGYTKSDGTNTNTTTANSHGSIEHIGQGRRPVREDYDYFSNKPQQHRRGPTKETDLDRDDGGIFKGRLNHRERAREVDETHETKVDLPIGHREVETVDDEHLYGAAGRTPRRPPQPPSLPKVHHAVANSRQMSPPIPPIKSLRKKHDDDDDKSSMYNDHHSNRHEMPTNGFHDDRRPSASSPSLPPVHSRINDHSDDHRQPQFSSSERPNESDQHQAATVIQSRVRGYLSRKQAHNNNDHDQQHLPLSPQHHQQTPTHQDHQFDRHQPPASKKRDDDDDEDI